MAVQEQHHPADQFLIRPAPSMRSCPHSMPPFFGAFGFRGHKISRGIVCFHRFRTGLPPMPPLPPFCRKNMGCTYRDCRLVSPDDTGLATCSRPIRDSGPGSIEREELVRSRAIAMQGDAGRLPVLGQRDTVPAGASHRGTGPAKNGNPTSDPASVRSRPSPSGSAYYRDFTETGAEEDGGTPKSLEFLASPTGIEPVFQP